MGHENGKTFAKYVSVRDDVQSAFMGTPARKALLDLSCNASLTRDISAPNSLNEAQKLGLELDPDLTRLKEATALLRRALIKDFGQLEKARKFGESRYRELRRLQEAIRTHRKRLFNAAKKRNRDHFFDNIGNRIIEANHQGNPIKFNPDLSHIQPERKDLADLEFKNRDTDNLDRATLIEDRIRSLELRLQLEKLHIPQGLHRKIDFSKMERKIADVKEEDAKQANSTVWESKSGLECPICLGRSRADPAAREYSFSRKDSLVRHFKKHQLQTSFGELSRPCDIPGCVDSSPSLPLYLSHLHKKHRISL
jgi:hypothetical protein